MPAWLVVAMALSGLSPLGLVAALWKFGLPWLREQVAQPAQAAAHAVTVNHHSSAEPTVLDKIEDVHEDVRDLNGEVKELREQLIQHMREAAAVDAANGVRLEGHDRELGRINAAVFYRRPPEDRP